MAIAAPPTEPVSPLFEHIGGPLHLQKRAVPGNQWRGYMYNGPVPEAMRADGKHTVLYQYHLRTVHLRDKDGHLRVWTGMVFGNYWTDTLE